MNIGIFRAYDIRGKYPLEINEEVTIKIVQRLGHYFNLKAKSSPRAKAQLLVRGYKLKAKIVIGHDARLSSPNLYRAATKGLQTMDYRLQLIKVGLATTPMLTFLVNYFKAAGGIMITASHNPKEYNGLKVVGKNAEPIGGKDVLRIMNNES